MSIWSQDMIHFKIIFLGVVALSLSACVTSSSPDDLGKLVYTGFVERSDGTAYHKSMGVSCPETVVEAICKLARDIYLTVEMTVRDERGLALQNSEVLVDVINASKGP